PGAVDAWLLDCDAARGPASPAAPLGPPPEVPGPPAAPRVPAPPATPAPVAAPPGPARPPLHHAVALMLVCTAANLAGLHVAEFFRLPLFLDMAGTAIVAISLGPWYGAAVGLATNAL